MSNNNRAIRFDFGEKPEEKTKDKPEEKIDEILRRADPSSAEEQARRFEEVTKDPPVKGYGKVSLHEAVDNNGNALLAMPDEHGDVQGRYADGTEVMVTVFDPLFEIDLYELFQGQLSETPINVIPNLIDEKCQLVANENKEWKPEKAKRDWTQWYWIIVAASLIPMIIVGVSLITGAW